MSLVNKVMKKARNSLRKLGKRRKLAIRQVTKDAYDDQKYFLSRSKVSVIFDVGAHTGQTVERYTKRFPEATIHTFEPFKESFDILSKRFKGDARIIPHNLAFSNQAGTLEFFGVAHNSQMNSLLPPAASKVPSSTSVTVQAATLDQFCDQHAIDCIDILKLDVQGAEIMVLEGAQNLLAAGKVKLIYTEFSVETQYDGQASLADIIQFLQRYNYRLVNLYVTETKARHIEWGDAIFMRA